MGKDLLRIATKTIDFSFSLLFFLVPLIMTPFNYELFEFNKMILVYLLTAIILTAWLARMIILKKFVFRRTYLDLPLILFLLTQILATLFSIDRHTSFWGYYSRSHGGLLSTLSYLVLYWVFVTHFDKKKALSLLRYSLLAASLVAAYGITEHFGIDAQYWVQDVQNRVFSTLGQPNWLAAYLVALIPLSWSLIIKEKKSYLYLFAFFLFFLCLLYTKSRSGLLGFLATYLIFWGLLFKQARLPQRPFLITTIIAVILALLVGTPWTPSLSQLFQKQTPVEEVSPLPSGGTESGEIRKIVWQGAIDVWRHHSLLGTGVETFAYAYYWYRPREHNDVSEWDFLYNKAHNEYLNLAATTGTLGLLAYLFVITRFIKQGLKHKKEVIPLALLAGFSSLLVTNFFGFSVVIIGLFFFLFPATSIVFTKRPRLEKERVQKLSHFQSGLLVFVSFVFLFSLYSLLRFWYADTIFAQGEKLNQASQYQSAFEKLESAVRLRKSEPFYRDELSRAAGQLALLAFDQDEASLGAELIDLAIDQSDQALKTSPYQLNFWKNRTRLFYSLAEIDEQYNQDALEALLRAAELAPTDAKVSYNLGLMYARLGQIETAIQTLEKTIELKPNYRNARYALALFYEQEKDFSAAQEQLEYILEKINPEDEEVKEKLKSF